MNVTMSLYFAAIMQFHHFVQINLQITSFCFIYLQIQDLAYEDQYNIMWVEMHLINQLI